MLREFPQAPLIGVGAVIVDEAGCFSFSAGREPLKGHCLSPAAWSKSASRSRPPSSEKSRKRQDCSSSRSELIELLDRIHREGDRIRYHYVIADILRVMVAL